MTNGDGRPVAEGHRLSTLSSRAHYTVVCSVCGLRSVDDGLTLTCPEAHEPGLLRTEYSTVALSPRPHLDGLYRYGDWLPIVRTLPGAPCTVVHRLERFGRHLGLFDLWVAFSGYWPERQADLDTGTFKDLEAYTVLARLPQGAGPLVVASAGNTAAAFGSACSLHGFPCLLIVPAAAVPTLRLRQPLGPTVRLVALDDADYTDAIEFAKDVTALPGFHAEGGALNVGRRDGLATPLYVAVETIGRMPDHYFQAVGSGVGAIAVHEAAGRVAAGRPDDATRPRLMLAQNTPFTPIVDAWRARRADLGRRSPADDRRNAARIGAKELTNRCPPYAIAGGVRDVLRDSDGDVFAPDNAAARRAAALFEEFEGIDVEPAAGVAVAALLEAVGAGRVRPDATVLLHVTGGGRRRLGHDVPLVTCEPTLRLHRDELPHADARERVREMFAAGAAEPGGVPR